jgi:hypothetical protein
VQQELITEFHRTTNWSVVVTVGDNISKPKSTDFINGDCYYIILIPDGKYKSFVTEFYGLVSIQANLKRIWKSGSRFVVAGVNECSMSQQKNIFIFSHNLEYIIALS